MEKIEFELDLSWSEIELVQCIGIGSILKRMYGWQQRNKKNCFSKKFGGNNRCENIYASSKEKESVIF